MAEKFQPVPVITYDNAGVGRFGIYVDPDPDATLKLMAEGLLADKPSFDITQKNERNQQRVEQRRKTAIQPKGVVFQG